VAECCWTTNSSGPPPAAAMAGGGSGVAAKVRLAEYSVRLFFAIPEL
jgi:hypothetical protein